MGETQWRDVVDKQACTELVYRLARAIDRCDEPLMRSLFHPGATDDHGMFQGSAADFVDWVLPVLAGMKRTQHFIGNVLIEIDGDSARGESYFIAHHTVAPTSGAGNDQVRIAAGRYLDRFERRGGEWRFQHRHAVYDWSAQDASSDTWSRAEPGAWAFGQRAPADASYAHFARSGACAPAGA
jgi:hypothetical protein